MTDSAFQPAHKNDFNAVYDLPDPRSYYRGLAHTQYRMPGVIAHLLRQLLPRLQAAGYVDNEMSVLDFACGYGAIGALLRHDVTMQGLYDFYGADSDSEDVVDSDRTWFGSRVLSDVPALRVAGLDVASRAVAYARALGFIDRAFSDDLAASPPGATLGTVLDTTHIIVESGGVGEIQTQVFRHVLESGARPWVLRAPRPDVDWSALTAVWDEFDYVSEPCLGPVRYRKCLGATEAAEVARLANAFGVPETAVFVDGYIAVVPMLSRPRADAARFGIDGLLHGVEDAAP